jgi:protein-tyrosine phosphatase
MAEVLDWRRTAEPGHAAAHIARSLAQGRLVAFPTETVYGIAASALVPDAVDYLVESKGRASLKPLTLAIRGADDVADWLPGLGAAGRRLARRCWPGPITLVSEEGVKEGLAARLPERVRQRVCPNSTLGLRAPAHEAICQVLRLLPGPLVLTSANRSGEPDATNADAVIEAVGDCVDLVIADGPCRHGKPSTVVEVKGDSWKILREGVMTAAMLERLTGCMIVFICTGNTCRSPMAEALFKKLLADRLGCQPDQLPAQGYTVRSAGLSAMSGIPAAPEAVEIAFELGADLSYHCSRPLTAELVRQADFLVTMTHGHLLTLRDQFPRLDSCCRLLSADGDDVPDPIGADQATYRACARQIMACLEKLVPEVQPR